VACPGSTQRAGAHGADETSCVGGPKVEIAAPVSAVREGARGGGGCRAREAIAKKLVKAWPWIVGKCL
jgi:hypothetical protein